MCETRKSSLLGKITVLVVICCCCLPAQGQYGGGTGEPNDPYLIYTAEQMNTVYWYQDKHFLLCADIDLSAYTGTAFKIIGTHWSNAFSGTFDGNGHTISNFTYDSNDKDYIGLFRYVDVGGEIKDLGLIEPNVDVGTGKYAGILAGRNYGTVTNCYIEGGSISGSRIVGGMVGINSGYAPAKGIIFNCYSTASVSGDDYIGGLAGSNLGTITNCYATSNVSGSEKVGGLVGRNYYSLITNCYSTGSVIGNWTVGGLVGLNFYGKVLGCCWDIQTSGQATSDGGTGKTTDQMQELNTYLYWGACGNEGVWTIDEGNDYPRLFWQNLPGVPIDTYGPVYGGGSGTEADPYLISTAEQFQTIGLIPCDWDKHFLLCADIDLSDFSGTEFNISGYYKEWNSPDNRPFAGVFDGNGHRISNFSYTSTNTHNIGLFGYVTGEIKNLGLVVPDVNAGTGRYVGSLVGRLDYGTVNKCYVKGGSVAGRYDVGGLVAYNNRGNISNCYATVSVEANEIVGGLVGNNGEGVILRCYSAGSVMGDEDAGGLVGKNSGAVGLSYWDIETSGHLQGDAGEGKSTAEMKSISNYQGWGCGEVWTIDDGVDYPRLAWENAAGIVIEDEPRYYGGGSGTESDPYLIYTAEQLNTIGRYPADLDCHFRLMADIDMSGARFNIIGYGAAFSGIFDGDGHVVRNVYYYQSYGGYMGLFSCVSAGGEIRNLGLEYVGVHAVNYVYIGGLVGYNSGTITNCYIIGGSEGYECVGCLIGYNHYGTITGCYSRGGVSGDSWIGGLVGYNHMGTISDCNSRARVSGPYNDDDADYDECFVAGGLVGMNTGMISNCRATISVWNGGEMVGGLIGENYKGTISNCYSTGGIECYELAGGLVGFNRNGPISECYSTTYVGGYVDIGGLTGSNSGSITNCYATGGVEGHRFVGGLAGGSSGPITNCYATGSVSGDNDVGGLVGYNKSGEITNSFWDIETSGQTSSAGGTGLPTDQMQIMSTFTDAGWDFIGETFNGIEDIWFIGQQDYPRLWWEGMQVPMKLTPGTLNCRSKGNWVKANLTLPEGFTIADVDLDRPAVLHRFGFQSLPLHVSVTKNKLVEIEASFERQALCSLTGDLPDELTVAGFLADGNIFLGTSTVRIIHPGMK